MVALQAVLEDSLDRERLADVAVDVTARVTARYRVLDVTDPVVPPPGVTVGVEQPMVMFSAPVVNHTAEIALAPVTAISGPDGVAELEWSERLGSPLVAAWDQLGPLLVAGGSRFVRFTASARLGGIGLPPVTLNVRANLGESVREALTVDLASTVVGHVTRTTARLWFRSHIGAVPADHTLRCVTRAAGRLARVPVDDQPVSVERAWAHTGVVDVAGLSEDTSYAFDLVLVGPAEQRWRLTGGELRTAPGGQKDTIRLAFASCNTPNSAARERWRALDDFHPDLTLLIGDQIYGDRVRVDTPLPTSDDWFSAYARRYAWSWSHPNVRDALRRRATYMMLDDHDVDDDWGVTFSTSKRTAEQPIERLEGAMWAYHAFQQAHSPTGRAALGDWTAAAIDYSVAWGPVGVYALDLRTRRGVAGAGSPVLGDDQIARFQAWAAGPARDADVIVLASPVPLAFVDTPALAAVLKLVDDYGAIGGAVAGAAIGGLFGGVAGAFVGWGIGALVGGAAADSVEETEGRITEPDLADQWSDDHNRPDLGIVLDALFDLANEPARPRAVFVVAGDVHVGAIHEIRSSAPAHGRNRALYQFTSSPIGADPAEEMVTNLRRADVIEAFDPDEWFELATTATGTYRARILGGVEGLLPVNNFGTLVINRQAASSTYDIRATIRGVSRPPAPSGWPLPAPREDLELALTYDLSTLAPPRPTLAAVIPTRAVSRPRP